MAYYPIVQNIARGSDLYFQNFFVFHFQEKTHECVECNRNFRHKGNLMRHMALHDPESSVQEKAMALKYGRHKKIQYIDGHQVEVLTGEDSEDEEDESK